MTTPVLLLHGQPGSAGDWDAVVAALGRRSSVAFDRPGWDGARSATDLAGNAAAALAALDAHGLGRAVVVGHSFGGAVAAWLAAHSPDRVAGLVLVAPSANMASLYAFDRVLAAPVVGEVLSAALLGAAGWGLSTRLIRRALGGEDRYLGSVARRLRSPSAWRAFVIEQRALVSELPLLERKLPALTVPTTIIGGTEDRIVPLSSLRKLRDSIPGAELVLVSGAGHLLPLRRASAVAEVIRRVG